VPTTLSKGYVQIVQRKGSSHPLCEEQVCLESFDLRTWLVVLYLKARLKLAKAINPLNAELNPICHLLALLGAHHILHVSRIRVKASIEISAQRFTIDFSKWLH